MNKDSSLMPLDQVQAMIYVIRGHRVMLDRDLAAVYGVEVFRLNEQVKRNAARFPSDFLLQLTEEEWEALRSQFAILNVEGRGRHRKYLPYAFTEHGAVMLANVLRSPVAVEASVQVVRAFIRLREMLASNAELAAKLETLEKKYDKQFAVVFQAVRELMAPTSGERKRVGFVTKDGGGKKSAE